MSLTFTDIRANFTEQELSTLLGDPELRRKAFLPIISDLFEDRVVYLERFLCVVRLKDFVIDEVGFRGYCHPELTIVEQLFEVPKDGWHFGGGWKHTRLIGNSLNDPYCGWTFWPEKKRVRRVIELAKAGDYKGALALTVEDNKSTPTANL